jgi:hypothetical protein
MKKRLQFQMPTWPVFDVLAVGNRQGLRRWSTQAVALDEAMLRAVPGSCMPALRRLRHELSPHASSRQVLLAAAGDLDRKVLVEAGIAAECSERFRCLFNGGGEALALFCCELNALATGNDAGVRTREVRTVPDKYGHYWMYPPSATIVAELEGLFAMLNQTRSQPLLFRCVALFVSFLCLHPFLDGNGRTARMLFNLLLVSERETGPYLPLNKIFALADMGFELRMRYTCLTGDWNPVMAFFVDAMAFLNCLSNEGMDHEMGESNGRDGVRSGSGAAGLASLGRG